MEGLTDCFPPGYPGEKDEDFEMTHQEFNQIKDALKDANFRKLLSEYVEDVQNPETQATYQKEMRELEMQRGNIIHFLNPIPGYVLKTSADGDKKAFINICSNPIIRKLSCKQACQSDKSGFLWSIPYAQSPPRDDFDKAGRKCVVYDIIFNPITVDLAGKYPTLKEKVESTAVEAVERNFNVSLDKNNIRKPNAKFKGMTKATVIKYKTGEDPPEIIDLVECKEELPPQPKDIYSYSKASKDASKEKNCSTDSPTNVSESDFKKKAVPNEKISNVNEHTVPNYKWKYRSHVDMQDYCFDNQREGRSTKAIPEEIHLTVDLPMLKDSSTIDADVVDDGKRFEMKSEGKIKYYLNVKLAFQVKCEAVKASFDKDKRKLLVIMKTVQKKLPTNQMFRSDPDISSKDQELETESPVTKCVDKNDEVEKGFE